MCINLKIKSHSVFNLKTTFLKLIFQQNNNKEPHPLILYYNFLILKIISIKLICSMYKQIMNCKHFFYAIFTYLKKSWF